MPIQDSLLIDQLISTLPAGALAFVALFKSLASSVVRHQHSLWSCAEHAMNVVMVMVESRESSMMVVEASSISSCPRVASVARISGMRGTAANKSRETEARRDTGESE